MNSENKHVTLSIIVMAYNHENYLAQCLESILSQKTNFTYEIILGEDCSNDKTRDICINYSEKYPNKIKLFLRHREDVIYINEKPTGRFNFIECFNSCTGKYIAICDGDDYWIDPLKLQKQVDFLEGNSDYVLCFHKINILKPNDEIIEDYITVVPENYEQLETFIEHGNFIHTPSVVFRNAISNFPFEFKVAPLGDFYLYFILAHYGKFKYIEETMAIYRSDVGLISKMTEQEVAANYVKLYSCMLSYTTDESIKKIILNKQKTVLDSYIVSFEDKYWRLKNRYNEAFISNHQVFRIFKYIQTKIYKFKSK